MRILFDHGTPAPLRNTLVGHAVSTAHEMRWHNLSNGELLDAAQAAFDCLITTDKNIKHQQNLSGLKIAIIVLPTTSWPRIQQHQPLVVDAVNSIKPGEFREVQFP